MKAVFLDTSGWFAALSDKEQHHAAAVAAYSGFIKAGVQMVTTNLVIAEMHILLSRFRGPGNGFRFLESVYQDATHEVQFVDRDLEHAATDRWLRKFSDQSFSLADAVSFEVMRMRRIKQALALDEHFKVAGFVRLPK